MKPGIYISGSGHMAMLLWALVAGVFDDSPADPPEQVAQVSLISVQDFAAMTSSPPDLTPDIAAPQQPEDVAQSPAAPSAETQPDIAGIDTPEAPQQSGQAPDVSGLAPPVAEATTDAPDLAAPGQDQVATLVPGTALDGPDRPVTPSLAPQTPPDPGLTPSPRVDTTPAPRPDPAALPDDTTQTRSQEDPDATQDPAETTDQATAPQEASTQTVTEANEGSAAPARSLRPRSRPRRGAGSATAQTDQPSQADQIAAAIAQATAEANSPEAPLGPPLTTAEKDGLRIAVQKCWNVGSLSSEALRTRVTIAMRMTVEGKPEINSLKLLGFEGGTEAAALQAYETARRAIIRCGARGYDLPADKYEQWREIEMTFNPEQMRIR